MKLHNKQKTIVQSKARFKIVRGGRRGGKTKLEVEDMCFEAMGGKDRPIFYIAPTQTQARAIIWEELKNRLAGIGEANEARLEMKVPTVDGGWSIITVSGWENRENFRGRKAWKIYFDEVDTMKDFFIGFQEIFRPALTDFKGHAMFSGTPKKENPNLRRLETKTKVGHPEYDNDFQAFHFTTYDNPHINPDEIEKARTELDYETFQQEYMAEYIENAGALFKYTALLDSFSNTVTKNGNKYLIIDVADDGNDKVVFSFWDGMEEYRREEFEHMNTETGIAQTREYANQERIPFSHILIDGIGVGAGWASSSMLEGCICYKSSYGPIKTDIDIIRLPNVSYTRDAPLVSDYKNLRSQCVFVLADNVNNHRISSKITGRFKEKTIEELSLYQDASTGDGKRMATQKEDVKIALGRSPDHSDTWIMRMYFVIKEKMLPQQSEENSMIRNVQSTRFATNRFNQSSNSNK